MNEIYLDNAATTQTKKEVAAVAVEMMYQEYGNPSSLHEKGFTAAQALTRARRQIATALGVAPNEVLFTAGGTEANNLALQGAARAKQRQGKKIITTQTEHASVLETLAFLEQEGFEIVRLAPRPDGRLDISALLAAVDNQTILVSCMLVNSELGSISDIEKAVSVAKRKNPSLLFHTDAVQAFGKLPFSASRFGVDLLTISGHKIYAPKGAGALYIKKGTRIVPLTYGGTQEQGVRPGTENMPAICAMGHAAEVAHQNTHTTLAKVRGLHDYFFAKAAQSPGVSVNSPEDSSPYICNISIPGYRSEPMLHYLATKYIYVSSGSACAKGEKSHVLAAVGLSNQRIDSALRISFSYENTTEQIDTFFAALQQGRKELIRS